MSTIERLTVERLTEELAEKIEMRDTCVKYGKEWHKGVLWLKGRDNPTELEYCIEMRKHFMSAARYWAEAVKAVVNCIKRAEATQ